MLPGNQGIGDVINEGDEIIVTDRGRVTALYADGSVIYRNNFGQHVLISPTAVIEKVQG